MRHLCFRRCQIRRNTFFKKMSLVSRRRGIASKVRLAIRGPKIMNVDRPPAFFFDPTDEHAPKRAIVGLAVLAVCLTYGCLVPAISQFEMVDHHVFLRATSLMRGGLGYYPAMDQALREVYGPAESVRAFRMPTIFFLWRWLPSPSWIWAVYLAATAVTGWFLLAMADAPVTVLVPVIYLLNNAVTRHEGGWLLQYTATELWAVPFVAASLLAWRARKDSWAAALALASALVRETTAGLLLGGIAIAYWERRRLAPWLAATLVATLAFAAHTWCVSSYLVAPGYGRETPLLGTGGLLPVARMAGFGLPFGEVVGPVLWIAAMLYALTRVRWERLALPHLALPLTGFLCDRPCWGILIVPFTILLVCNAVRSSLGQLPRLRRQAI
jgi:hypothetical protein